MTFGIRKFIHKFEIRSLFIRKILMADALVLPAYIELLAKADIELTALALLPLALLLLQGSYSQGKSRKKYAFLE